MDFISNSSTQNQEMLAAIGVSSIEDLFKAIPDALRQLRLKKDDGISEFEGIKLMEMLAAKNTFSKFENYLGAGAYEHHVPALVGAVCAKSEFLTSYTPYQPESSQGMLQAIFEFQSLLCALTGLDVSNASLYDGASACAEGVLMALRLQKPRHKVLIAGNVHPHYLEVVQQYLGQPGIQIEIIPFQENGHIDINALKSRLDESTAALLIQSPNFFGGIEDVRSLSQLAKEKGILTVLCSNILAYGLFASAAELNVDIAVGDCQPLGLPLQFGGPYVGYITCRQEFVRQLPGRLVGETVDTQGRRGFVLTFQAREQHIRREKATSNICTNQALAALATLVASLWYGPKGLYQLALTNYQRAAYLREQLASLTATTPFSKVPCFNEFVVKCKQPLSEVQRRFQDAGIIPGLDLGNYYPQLQDHLLIAVTETKTKEQLDLYCKMMKEVYCAKNDL